MEKVIQKLLKEIYDSGYQAYVVGGYVRDYLLGQTSNDIDVCTDATPKELKEIFPEASIPKDDYGSVIVNQGSLHFEITTFRKEISYQSHRFPVKLEYIKDLYQDLLRRDFTINSICIDQEGNIIDHLHGRRDLELKVIRTIGDAFLKFEQDALRILRAVRFATTLDFELSPETEEAILKHKHLLRELSYERKREELDKIFTSKNAKAGISLLIQLGLDQELELTHLKEVSYTDSLIAIWAVLDVLDLYPFTSNERDLICDIKEAYLCQILDPFNLYKYGLYVSSVAGEMKGESVLEITKAYDALPISSRRDIAVDGDFIAEVLGKEPGPYLKDVYEDLEREILYHNLKNEREAIIQYCLSTYQ